MMVIAARKALQFLTNVPAAGRGPHRTFCLIQRILVSETGRTIAPEGGDGWKRRRCVRHGSTLS